MYGKKHLKKMDNGTEIFTEKYKPKTDGDKISCAKKPFSCRHVNWNCTMWIAGWSPAILLKMNFFTGIPEALLNV